MLNVLGIDVSPELLERWADWLAPDEQPFFVTPRQARDWKLTADEREPNREDRDTYWIYAVDRKAARTVWLTEAAFLELPRVSAGLGASRHAEVRSWPAEFPRARELAGSFADGSGPNCFGTVMAACGVEGAESVWMVQGPFEEWLAGHTEIGGKDEVPGTVFVWRDTAGLAQHAALTIGDGWMVHKPSQS